MSSYSYDSFGNITETERPNSAGVTVKNTYSYENSSWRDLLTAYNGHTIIYDKIGNPLSYYNGRSYTLRWEMGRQLLSSQVNSRTVYYDYNKDGIRIEKNVSGRYTDRYILDGSKVIGMERTKSGSSVKDVYHFIYDEMGNIWEAVCYIGGSTTPVRYFYRTNAQGDVKQIVDSNYNVVAYYAYDAWGKLLAVLDGNDNPITDSSHFAIVNPFRYRGYVYDTETGFYYLQSRYYDPEICRFINADGQLNQQESISGYNLFAYCGNNPVIRFDPFGKLFLELIGLAVVFCGVALACTGSSSKNESIDPEVPPPPSTGYVPPKKNPNPKKVRNPNGKGYGWPSESGGVWVPDNKQHGGAGWTEQFPNGKHKHHYPGGHVRESITISISESIDFSTVVGTGLVALGTAAGAYIIANDVTGVGIIDDWLLGPLGALVKLGDIIIYD